MICEIRTSRTVSIDPNDKTFSVSEWAQLSIRKQEIKRGKKAKRRILPGGQRTTVGPLSGPFAYAVAVSDDETRGELIRSLSGRAVATYRGVYIMPDAEKEIDRTQIEVGECIPLAEAKIAPLLSLRASINEGRLRRVMRIKTRFFVANVSTGEGITPADMPLPRRHAPSPALC